MCKHQEYKSGIKSFGDRLPGYAQGAYLPGDEPGIYCKKSGCRCYLDGWDDQPELCDIQEYTEERCPDCGTRLMKNGNGVIYCLKCQYQGEVFVTI